MLEWDTKASKGAKYRICFDRFNEKNEKINSAFYFQNKEEVGRYLEKRNGGINFNYFILKYFTLDKMNNLDINQNIIN